MQCPACRTTNQPWAAFCVGCGEPLGASAPAGLAAGEPVQAGPPGRHRAGRRGIGWQAGLGFVLVAVLIAVVAGDLLADGSHADAYRAGRGAEAARHWDSAVAALAGAGAYRDAPQRAQAAARQVQTRDALYAAGQAAAGRGAWPAAAAAFAQAAGIQPDYADVAARWAEAQRQATRLVAAGLIYRRPAGPDAGLYLIGPLDRPSARLPGSDGNSEVLAFTPDGRRVVYDGPGGGPQRGLFLAGLDPAAGTVDAPRALPAGLAPDGWGTFAPGGLWWSSDVAPALSYLDLAGGQVAVVATSSTLRVLGEDVARGRLLLASLSTAGGRLRSRILLAGPDGSHPRVLLDSPGAISSAELSPDGNWLLYSREEVGALVVSGHGGDFRWHKLTWVPHRDDARTTSLLLAWAGPGVRAVPGATGDVDPPQDRLLDYLVLPDDAPAGGAGISAHFVPNQPATVAVDHSGADRRSVAVYDAVTSLETTFFVNRAPSPNLTGPYFSPQGGYLLIEEAAAGGVHLVAQALSPDGAGATRVVPVALPPDGLVLGQITLHDDYLLYLVTQPRTRRAREEYRLYSLPVAATSRPRPAELLFDSLYAPGVLDAPSITLAPAGTLLAYVRPDGVLLGLPFAGGAPIRLAAGVREVWSPLP